MTTSIASYASSAAQVQQLADRNIAVAKRAQDHQKLEGQAAVSLIESAGKVQSGAQTGHSGGGRVDVIV